MQAGNRATSKRTTKSTHSTLWSHTSRQPCCCDTIAACVCCLFATAPRTTHAHCLNDTPRGRQTTRHGGGPSLEPGRTHFLRKSRRTQDLQSKWPYVSISIWCKYLEIRLYVFFECAHCIDHVHVVQPAPITFITLLWIFIAKSAISSYCPNYLQFRSEIVINVFSHITAWIPIAIKIFGKINITGNDLILILLVEIQYRVYRPFLMLMSIMLLA